MKIHFFSLLSLIMVIGIPPTFAGHYYISPNGNDANTGTLTSPWKTFSYALCGGSYGCPCSTSNQHKIAAGDTLYVRGGTYDVSSEIALHMGMHGGAVGVIGSRLSKPDYKNRLTGSYGLNAKSIMKNCTVYNSTGKRVNAITGNGIYFVRDIRDGVFQKVMLIK